MDTHVDEEAAAAGGPQILHRWRQLVLRTRLENYGRADFTGRDPLLRRRVGLVEPPHETELEKHPALRHRRFHRFTIRDIQRQRLFAKNRLLGRRRGDHDLTVQFRRCHHHNCVDRGIRHEIVIVEIGLGRPSLGRDRLRGGGVDIRHRVQARTGNARGEIAGILAAEAAEPDDSDVEWLVHGKRGFANPSHEIQTSRECARSSAVPMSGIFRRGMGPKRRGGSTKPSVGEKAM